MLNDNEEMALIDILVCACKQAFTRQGPPGRTSRKGKEKKASMDERKNLSAHLMPTLPRLLNKVSDQIIITIGIVYVYAVISIPNCQGLSCSKGGQRTMYLLDKCYPVSNSINDCCFIAVICHVGIYPVDIAIQPLNNQGQI